MGIFEIVTTHEEFQNRFWAKVAIGHPDDCWNWTGCVVTKGDGYGRVKIPVLRKTERPHRVSFMLSEGIAIPRDKIILHACDNRPCCNPNHLSLGTHDENMADMAVKGRAFGTLLTKEDVLRIRQLIDEGKKNTEIALDFSVAATTISAIKQNKIWKHVKI